MKNSEELIGKKVRGFEFEDIKGLYNYVTSMDKHIDKVGLITKYRHDIKCFKVDFEDIFYYYPADQIETHLVEENEIPTLSDGVMMLVSDDGKYFEKRYIYFKNNNKVYRKEKDGSFIGYKYYKPLEPTKEEQLTAILGSSDKVAEIMELFKDKK